MNPFTDALIGSLGMSLGSGLADSLYTAVSGAQTVTDYTGGTVPDGCFIEGASLVCDEAAPLWLEVAAMVAVVGAVALVANRLL